MKKSFLLLCLAAATAAQAQNAKPSDGLGVPGPISFQKQAYGLAWTSHPTATYFKQEYIPQGDTVERFKTMLLLEVLLEAVTPKDAAAAKLAELKRLKEKNPAVQCETFGNPKTGEYMIHFLVTAAAPDGRIGIAERNVYRYKTFTGSKGKTGLLLFGLSQRGYAGDASGFIADTKKNKAALVNEVAQMALPEVKL